MHHRSSIDTTVGDAYIESFEKARREITAQLHQEYEQVQLILAMDVMQNLPVKQEGRMYAPSYTCYSTYGWVVSGGVEYG